MMRIWRPGDPAEKIDFSFLSWVTDDIAICSYDTACDPDVLRIEEIKTVISIGTFQAIPDDPRIVHEGFPFIQDATLDISEKEISDVLNAIENGERRGKTLVHCAAGISRSPGFVTLHLALSRGISWEKAKEIVHRGREKERIHPLTEITLKKYLERRRQN